ncbi:MAG: Lrp/AsnC ligand binding domain-containing protein [Rhodospirillaceae bacterium]|nr:Lrp/AsnC ligand binding domain-containing protein [Rhodospirillaceae bacterium]MBL6931777.1 Lrp/AsnC ligand binding domain-containing protein [Rhodospirillales bacterium]
MQAVFIFIKCELGKAYAVANALIEKVEQTSEVYSISGEFDLMAKFYIPNDNDIGHFVNEQVHHIAGIKDTQTIITFNAFT